MTRLARFKSNAVRSEKVIVSLQSFTSSQFSSIWQSDFWRMTLVWCVCVVVEHSIKAADKLPFVLVEVKNWCTLLSSRFPQSKLSISCQNIAKAAVLPSARWNTSFLSKKGNDKSIGSSVFRFFPRFSSKQIGEHAWSDACPCVWTYNGFSSRIEPMVAGVSGTLGQVMIGISNMTETPFTALKNTKTETQSDCKEIHTPGVTGGQSMKK